ncbi:class I SAM-dependent methyltransferase [Jannaschia sp. LMIT008]|uniref:class I SAM-dependent methyltransferase n=1 Tax=Jannaschia maritima TaxID=3032585 RepID=UPI0028127485|nr:class I SAM-dependent methyltransferase [Jannaschia sp. LMIT008]
MDPDAISRTYRQWAPIYDRTFGALTRPGRLAATARANERGGRVLEVGVGTGLALRHYTSGIHVTGIDFSDDMLRLARAKVGPTLDATVDGLHRMDARTLDFPDGGFDTVVAMYLISVVPEPERVMAEMARVCRPDGEIVVVNHFAGTGGVIGGVERLLAPFADRLGWHADFDIGTVVGSPHVGEVERRSLPPLGLFTFLRLTPRGDAVGSG